MPDITNAITGQASIERKRQKLSHAATTQFNELPNWMKSWTYQRTRDFIDENVTNIESAKTVLKGLAQFCIVLRDLLKQYQQEE